MSPGLHGTTARTRELPTNGRSFAQRDRFDGLPRVRVHERDEYLGREWLTTVPNRTKHWYLDVSKDDEISMRSTYVGAILPSLSVR